MTEHSISFSYDFTTKEETASCSCGEFFCRSLSRTAVQLLASVHCIEAEQRMLTDNREHV